jgi:hypothetical protein
MTELTLEALAKRIEAIEQKLAEQASSPTDPEKGLATCCRDVYRQRVHEASRRRRPGHSRG